MAKSQSVWRGFSVALALGAGLTSATVGAKDLVWTGGAGVAGTPILGDRDWYYQVCVFGCWQPNWNGGSFTNQTDDYPVFQDRLLFKNNGASKISNNNLNDRFIKQIVVDPTAPSYTITGKAFTLAPTSDIDDVGIHKFGRNTTLKIENDITLSGEVDFRNDGVIELTGVISGGSLTKTAGGTLVLNGTDYTGFTSIRAGKVFLDGGSNTIAQSSRVELSGNGILETDAGHDSVGGTLLQNINSLSGTGGQIRLGAFSDLIVNSNHLGTKTFAGSVTGSGDFTKSGGGTLVLSGRNSNTGALTINSGTLVLSNSNVNKGETQINGGSLVVAAGDSLSNSSLIRMSGGTLKYNSGVNDTAGGLHGTGSVVLESGSSGRFGGANTNATFDGVISGTGEFVKNGTAQQTLRGNNTYTGKTIARAGVLRLDNDDVIADASAVSVETNGTLVLSSHHTDTVGSLSGTGDVTVEAGSTLTIGADGTDTTYSGSVRGDGALVKTGSGTMTFDGGGTLSVDELTVAGGQVRLNGTGALEMSSITVNSGTSLNFFGRTRLDHVSADLLNNGFVFARLSGTIFDGDMSGDGDFGGRAIFTGSYGPGNSPALVQHQTTQFTSTHTLYMELGGLNRGSEYDAIDAFSVTLSGLLDVSLIDLNNGFSPMAGDTFDLIIANQIIGNFSSFSFAALADGLFWTTQLISSGSQMIYQLMVAGQLNAAVPGPGAIFILIVGLVGLVVVRRRSRVA